MIRVLATVAMDYGIILDRSVLESWPKGGTMVFGKRMAQALHRPIAGQRCLVLDRRGLKGWGRTDTIPDDCVVVGSFDHGLAVADAVTLVVMPVAQGSRRLDLIDFEEASRERVGEVTLVHYNRMH